MTEDDIEPSQVAVRIAGRCAVRIDKLYRFASHRSRGLLLIIRAAPSRRPDQEQGLSKYPRGSEQPPCCSSLAYLDYEHLVGLLFVFVLTAESQNKICRFGR